jgi:hypothetical protein
LSHFTNSWLLSFACNLFLCSPGLPGVPPFWLSCPLPDYSLLSFCWVFLCPRLCLEWAAMPLSLVLTLGTGPFPELPSSINEVLHAQHPKSLHSLDRDGRCHLP